MKQTAKTLFLLLILMAGTLTVWAHNNALLRLEAEENY